LCVWVCLAFGCSVLDRGKTLNETAADKSCKNRTSYIGSLPTLPTTVPPLAPWQNAVSGSPIPKSHVSASRKHRIRHVVWIPKSSGDSLWLGRRKVGINRARCGGAPSHSRRLPGLCFASILPGFSSMLWPFHPATTFQGTTQPGDPRKRPRDRDGPVKFTSTPMP